MPSRRVVEQNRHRLSKPESILSTRGTILEGERFPRSYAVEDREEEEIGRFSTRNRDEFSEDERGHDQTKDGELKRRAHKARHSG